MKSLVMNERAGGNVIGQLLYEKTARFEKWPREGLLVFA